MCYFDGIKTICCKCPRSNLVISFLRKLFPLPTADPYAEAPSEAVSTLCVGLEKQFIFTATMTKIAARLSDRLV